MRQLRPETGESFAIFFKTLIQLYFFINFSIFDLLYQRGYQRKYFWAISLKLLAYEATVNGNGRKGGGFGDQCIFFFNADVKFAKFGLPVMDGYSSMEGIIYLQVSCGVGKEWEEGFSEGGNSAGLCVPFREAVLFRCIFIFFGGGGWFRKSANCKDLFFR